VRKAKTNKALAKRFKITGTGKLLRHKQGRRHLMTKKSSRQKRRLEKAVLVGASLTQKFKRLILGM
jgi:large subunit ribosomal protein L35